MQNTSILYKSLAGQSGRAFVVKIYTNRILTADQVSSGLFSVNCENNTLLLTGDDIMDGSLQIQQATTAEGDFDIGGAVIGQLEFEMDNTDDRFKDIDFLGTVFDVRVGLIVGQDYNCLLYTSPSPRD